MKVVINTKAGGFTLSDAARAMYCAKKAADATVIEYEWEIDRTDIVLVDVVEKLGEDANTICSRLKVVDIPDDVEWEIITNDSGTEFIIDRNRTWR